MPNENGNQNSNTRNQRRDALDDEHTNIYANEIVRSLFGGGTGNVKGDFPCMYGRNRGRLYVASDAVCFYSYFFGYEQKILLLFDTVQSIDRPKKNTITVFTKENEEHIFWNFRDRDIVWEMLDDLFKKSIIRTKPKKTSSNNIRETSAFPKPSSQEKVGVSNETSANVSSAFVPRTRSESRDLSSPISRHSPDSSHLQRQRSISADIDQKPSYEEKDHEIHSQKPLDLKTAWTTFRAAYLLQDCLDQTVHSDHFDCSLDEYFNTFLANDAFFPMEIFQKEKYGDSNFITSKWKEVENENTSNLTVTMERQITYVHPNKATMGPSMIYVTQYQKFCRYGEHGMWFWKRSQISGVPAADCFHVDVENLFEPNDDGIEMKTQFQIIFKKRTMLRSIIETSSKSECIEGLKESVQYIRDALKGEVEKEGEKDSEWLVKLNEIERLQYEFQSKTHKHLAMLVISIVFLTVLLFSFSKKIQSLNEELSRQDENWKLIIQSLETKINEIQIQLQTQKSFDI